MKKVVFLGVFAALSPLLPAHAIVLEQKWTPGQDLNYQTALRGTMNVLAPANINFPLAGVPFDVEIRGDGVAQFKTISVDEAGVGTVAVQVPQFNLNAASFGQNGQLLLTETGSKISLNGRPIKLGDGTNPLGTATTALRISPQGRVLGVQSLAPTIPLAPKAGDDALVAPVDALNKGALMTAAILRALPTFWPGRDVADGETWKVQAVFPIASPTDPQKITPTQLGEWSLTLKGAEMIGGRELQRVSIIGAVGVKSEQFVAPTAQIPSGTARQNVNGDVWFDAGAGQIARANLIIGARVEAGKGTDAQGHADFTGTLQLNLKRAA